MIIVTVQKNVLLHILYKKLYRSLWVKFSFADLIFLESSFCKVITMELGGPGWSHWSGTIARDSIKLVDESHRGLI